MNLIGPTARVFSLLLIPIAVHAQSFVEVTPTHETREYPGLALLPNGKVLATTGHPLNAQSLDSSEVYDPDTDSWTMTDPLHVPRNGVAPGGLVAIDEHRFLIVGGGSGAGSTASTEIYDAREEKWAKAADLAEARANHTTSLLKDGRVLVAGGIEWATNALRDSAEIYDPASDEWSLAGSMNTVRTGHCAVVLKDGRVLVMGGADAEPWTHRVRDSCEIYNPDSNEWTETSPMLTARRAFRAVVLKDGRVLAIGGNSGDDSRAPQLDRCEIYDPKTGTWTETDALRQGRWGPTATLLADGRVLITGGMRGRIGRLATSEIFDPEEGTWSAGPNLNQARNGHRAITLKDGRILIVGGFSGFRYLDSCEMFTP